VRIFSRNPFRRNSGSEDSPSARSWRRVALIGLLLVVIAFGCWLGYEAFHAKSSLEQARNDAQKSKEALLKGDAADAANWADQARTNAQAARDATQSAPWNIASAVPWLGGPFATGQQISDVVYGLAADVLQPSAHLGQAISPDQLLEGGRINVQALRDAEPQLAEISTAAKELKSRADKIADPGYLSVMRDARSELQTQTSNVSGLIGNAALAARLAPSMMGLNGPRTYFMGFQTNAEARGTGGLLGAFGILRFDNGAPSVDTLGQNVVLEKASAQVDLGPEFTAQYGFQDPTGDFRNSNLSPHFPYAAQIWKAMWEQQSGGKADGVISIDPVALSYILGAVGPVTMPDGETITADNVVELTESTAYTRFATDNNARKQYLQDVASEVVKKMTGKVQSPRQLLQALGKAVSEGRIAVWSSVPDEQRLLEGTPLGHVLPQDPAPYAAVVINNLGGNKLDYYLKRHIEYTSGACDGDTRQSTVTIRLTNNAPPEGPPGGLPDYVAGLHNDIPITLPWATNASSVYLFATTGAQLKNATVDGQPLTTLVGAERDHPVFISQVAIQPGQTVELRYQFTEPTAAGAPRVPIQPLIDTVTPVVSVPECSK
jgi:hypothetical protein